MNLTDDSLADFESNALEVADILRALANERRLMILCKLVEKGEASVGTLVGEVGVSQSALSQHLAKMREEAERIEEERSQKGLKLSGPEVAKRLVKATVAPAVKAAAEKEITGKGGKVILRYTKARGGGLTIKVPPKAEASPAELLKAIEGLLS